MKAAGMSTKRRAALSNRFVLLFGASQGDGVPRTRSLSSGITVARRPGHARSLVLPAITATLSRITTPPLRPDDAGVGVTSTIDEGLMGTLLH
jgi:hypothetical protein